MKKRVLSVLLCAAMVTAMAAGCGSENTQETQANTEEVTQAPADEDTQAAESEETQGAEDTAALPGGGSNIMYIITPSHSNPFFGTEAVAAEEKAKELGAARVFNSRNENIEEFVKTLPGGGVDQVYECAGNRITTLQTCRLIKRAGKITLVGVSPEPVLELDIATLNAMEGTIYSVYRYRNLYPSAISAVSKGLIPLKKIVSHTFDFKDVIEGVDYSLNHKDEVIKAVIRM